MTSLAHIETILWDWNGTLLDDVDLCVEVISELRQAHHNAVVTTEDYRAHFGFPVIRYYEHLGFDISAASFDRLSEVFISTYYDRFEKSPPSAHLETVQFARRWKAAGRQQAVLSASRQDHLEQAVRQLGLTDLFGRLGGIQDIYASSKVDRGRELLEQLGWKPSTTLLIGDTDHDAEVATAMGIQCLLLARGHQVRSRLEKTHPLVVDTLAEAVESYGLGRAYQAK